MCARESVLHTIKRGPKKKDIKAAPHRCMQRGILIPHRIAHITAPDPGAMSANAKSIDLGIHRFPAYISRLPPCTRVLILITVLASLVDLVSLADVQAFGALVPDKISIFSGESPCPQMGGPLHSAGRRREQN